MHDPGGQGAGFVPPVHGSTARPGSFSAGEEPGGVSGTTGSLALGETITRYSAETAETAQRTIETELQYVAR